MAGQFPKAFYQFRDYGHEISDILVVSILGLSRVQKAVGLIKWSTNRSDKTDEQKQKEISDAEKRAAFAQKEIEAHFPTLSAHAVVALWGAVEVFVHDLAIELVQKDKSVLSSRSFSKIRIRRPHGSLDERERIQLTVELFLQRLKTQHKTAIARFEELLKELGLGGSITDEIQDAFEEMQLVRNLLVHRAGIADVQFARRCRTLRVEPGHRIQVSVSLFNTYFTAATEYIKLLVARYQSTSAREQ